MPRPGLKPLARRYWHGVTPAADRLMLRVGGRSRRAAGPHARVCGSQLNVWSVRRTNARYLFGVVPWHAERRATRGIHKHVKQYTATVLTCATGRLKPYVMARQ